MLLYKIIIIVIIIIIIIIITISVYNGQTNISHVTKGTWNGNENLIKLKN